MEEEETASHSRWLVSAVQRQRSQVLSRPVGRPAASPPALPPSSPSPRSAEDPTPPAAGARATAGIPPARGEAAEDPGTGSPGRRARTILVSPILLHLCLESGVTYVRAALRPVPPILHLPRPLAYIDTDLVSKSLVRS